MKKNQIMIAIRAHEQTRRRFKSICAEEGITMEEAILYFIDQWEKGRISGIKTRKPNEKTK